MKEFPTNFVYKFSLYSKYTCTLTNMPKISISYNDCLCYLIDFDSLQLDKDILIKSKTLIDIQLEIQHVYWHIVLTKLHS